jgi:nucleoside-diphosphate-sugar epimerase
VVALPRELLFKPKELKRFLEVENPDYIFHLAAYGNMYVQTDERQTIESNIIGLFNLLEASKKINYKGLINFSSSSTLLPYETFYSATKGAGERIVEAFVNKYQKPVVTVRPYSVYGPGDNPNHFIPTAIKAFRTDLELKLSPGFHDWIHVSDLVTAVLIVIKNIEQLYGVEVNIGTGISTSNHAVISILRDFFGKPGKVIKVGELRAYDNENWVAKPDKLRQLGWEAEIDLEEGLEKLIYENN